jgi:hypothetical protein
MPDAKRTKGCDFMSRVLRLFGYGFLAVLVVILVLVALLVLYNLEDEALHPEVARLLAVVPSQIPAEENGYFAWIGVLGPQEVSPHAWGRRWFAEALAADREKRGPTLAIESELREESSALYQTPCNEIESCLDAVARRLADARQLLTQAKVLLKRCDSVLEYPDYQEPWRPQWSFRSAFPRYQFKCSRLQAMRFAVAVAENRDEAALGYLEKEMAFHIRQVRGAFSLIEKVVAIAHLQRDYLLLNRYFLLRADAAKRNAERLAGMLAPLDERTSGLATVLETELLLAARNALELPNWVSLPETDDDETWNVSIGPLDEIIIEWFYLPNATVNRYYKLFSPLFDIERLSVDAYSTALAEIADSQAMGEDGELFMFTLRNPAGNTWLMIGDPVETMPTYFRLRDDMLALRAAVAFQYDLLSRGIRDEESIAKELATAGLVHRYTGQAVIWDESIRGLTYPAVPQRQMESLSIRL